MKMLACVMLVLGLASAAIVILGLDYYGFMKWLCLLSSALSSVAFFGAQ
jgi:hypothetical protein